MKISKLILLTSTLIVTLLLTGCPHQAAVKNISNSQIMTSSNASMDQIESAIRKAGAGLGWQMKSISPGQMLGILKLRSHVATVDIIYNKQSFDITYKDSTNLNYENDDGEATIHSNYNGWIQNLEQAIAAQTSAI
ncbi:MAG: hypothetical protein KZQ96_03020 [Candidatus Thiodiazotropha sp. (ex Lucinoma borealis)]|nr:hypothetical protein [Candidatus Thiodiazotropha sp. (ex Lucinoma borealis)]MCU7867395.1 hypothetical protein [Candidatus Thiodiazotropha sp. (ex Lucinoma borealis)]